MRSFVCVDERDWKAVIRGAARFLTEGETTLAHVIDERGPRGYGLSLRGLLGRRGRGDRQEEVMAAAAREAAEGLLADAKALLKRLSPGLSVQTTVTSGDPNKELMRAANEGGAEIIVIGRGAPGARPRDTVSGVVEGWNENRGGRADALVLDDGTEVKFPPQRAGEVRAALSEGSRVEATGVWQGRRLHAYDITDVASGASVQAHEPPDEQPGENPLGHTARFVVDHALCDVVVVRL